MMSQIEVLTQIKNSVENKKCKNCGSKLTFLGVTLDGIVEGKGLEVGSINSYCQICGTEVKNELHIKI